MLNKKELSSLDVRMHVVRELSGRMLNYVQKFGYSDPYKKVISSRSKVFPLTVSQILAGNSDVENKEKVYTYAYMYTNASKLR